MSACRRNTPSDCQKKWQETIKEVMDDTFESPAKRRRITSPRRDILGVSDVQLIASNILQHAPKPTLPYYDEEEIRNFLRLLSISQHEQLQNYMNEKFETRLEIMRSSLGRRAPGLQAHEVLGASTILTSCSYLLGLPVNANVDAAEIVKALDRRGITPQQCRQSASWIRLLGVEIRMPPEKHDGSQFAQFQNWFEDEKEAKIIEVKPKKSCFYVDPEANTGTYVTKSITISLWALVTCLKYNVPLEAVLRNWWTLIDMARRVYYAELRAGKTYAQCIAEVWKAIQSDTKYCYTKDSINFLYDLYMYGKCQCSCGVIALREIMLQVDDRLQMWYALSQDHIMLGVQNAEGDQKYLETTAVHHNYIRDLKFMQLGFKTFVDPGHIFMINVDDILRDTQRIVQGKSDEQRITKVTELEQIKLLAKMGALTAHVKTFKFNFQNNFYNFLQLCNQFISGKLDSAFCEKLTREFYKFNSFFKTYQHYRLPASVLVRLMILLEYMKDRVCQQKIVSRRKWIEESETPTSDFRKWLLDQ
jgi:hypothetical protein